LGKLPQIPFVGQQGMLAEAALVPQMGQKFDKLHGAVIE
jgi:hypothetical protein